MKKINLLVMSTIAMLIVAAPSYAQSSWGNAFKSAAQAAGQAAIQSLTPQAQTTITESQKLGAGAPQENFILTKAKEFLAAGNYQPALDLANYVITTVNSKSIDAKKIMADAQAALTKMAQDKLAQTQANTSAATQAGQAKVQAAQQVKTDAAQTMSGVKSLFGTQK